MPERESPTGRADGAHLGFKALAGSAAAAWHHAKIRWENIARPLWFRDDTESSGPPEAMPGAIVMILKKAQRYQRHEILEASPGIEPGCKDLQSSA